MPFLPRAHACPPRVLQRLLFIVLMSCVAICVGCGGGSSSSIPVAPSGLSYPSPSSATVGTAITPLSPAVTGTITTYSVTPALPPGLSLNATTGVISGTPTASTVEATYSITASNAAGSTAFDLSLTVNPPGTLAISAASLTFANQLLSTASAAQSVAVINIGASALTVSAVTISGSAASSFADATACGSVPANGTCMISVTFTPSATGALAASLNIATSAGSSTVQLFGAGVAVDIAFSPAIVAAGNAATLTWSVPSATSCTASGSWSGAEPASGTRSVTQTSAGYYTYTLTCTGPSGMSANSALLTAYGPTPPVSEPAGELGYQADFYVAPPNQFVGLQTTLTVPPLPPVPPAPGAALFLWPGMDPATNSANFLPINNGVLQPVLSWGPSCAPTPQPTPFSSWWISAQYVNTFGSDPGYSGCLSGPSMLVNPGDVLLLNLSLDAASGIWTETVTDANTVQSVVFSIDMQGQGQNWAYWAMEFWYGATINAPVTFTNTTITFQSPDTANWCFSSQGANSAYIYTPPTPQNSSTQCFISSVVLTQP
ncbi:MAG: choice-of-anchor D domain-containing protein [Candidatus Acidiferrales bacterium]